MEIVISLIPDHCATDKSDTFRSQLNEYTHYTGTKVDIPNKNIIASIIERIKTFQTADYRNYFALKLYLILNRYFIPLIAEMYCPIVMRIKLRTYFLQRKN